MTDASENAPLRADSIEGSLDLGRRENARVMNQVRCGMLAGFLALYGIGIVWLDVPGFRESWWLLATYACVAVLLWVAGNQSSAVLNATRFAVPLIDLPAVTLIQHLNLPSSQLPEALSLFTLTVLCLLTTLSSFSMRALHLFACAAIGTLCIFTLYSRVEVTAISYFAAPLLLFTTAWMMSFLPQRQAQLIREGAERKARRDRLARHFSPGVAELIESHDEPGEGEACELSVLFCDIRGFTEISEPMEARDVVALLNEFHGFMVDAIFRFGGTLDKYLGDGLLAYFNAPARQKDHAERTVRCALAMVEDLETFNRKRTGDGTAPIRVGIGVHTGKAVVGEIGAAHRREFTAIGDTVNLGSRLQELTKNYESDVLISEAIVSQVKNAGDLEFESVGSVAVRGRKQEVEVFVPIRK